jgi:hypothetical protein
MTPGFTVRTTPHYERLFRSLQKQHPELRTLRNDLRALFSPLTRITAVGHHPIKKLTDVERGEGQYRLDCAAFGSGTTSTETRLCFSPAVFGERIRIGNAPAALGFIPTKVRKLS